MPVSRKDSHSSYKEKFGQKMRKVRLSLMGIHLEEKEHLEKQ